MISRLTAFMFLLMALPVLAQNPPELVNMAGVLTLARKVSPRLASNGRTLLLRMLSDVLPALTRTQR